MKWVCWTFMTALFFLLQGSNLPFYHRWTLHHEHHPSVHTQSRCMLWGQQFVYRLAIMVTVNSKRWGTHWGTTVTTISSFMWSEWSWMLGSLRGIVWTSELRLGSATDRVGSSSLTGEASCIWFSLQSFLLHFLLRPACPPLLVPYYGTAGAKRRT